MTAVARKSLYGFETRDIDNRRAPEGERKTYNIKSLWQRNHEILRLAVLGHNNEQIAKILEITKATVSNTLNSDLGRDKLSKLRLRRDRETIDVAKRVAELLPKAMDTYEKILDGDVKVTTMMKATADTIAMDIGGYRAPTKIQKESAHIHMTAADLEEFKKRGIEAARTAGLITEAEVVDG